PMVGTRLGQRGRFEADMLYGDHVGRKTFYGSLVAQPGALFPDEQFAALYVYGPARPSVAPSLLATALVLQAALALQASPDFGAVRHRRQTAEHRLARLVQFGIRQTHHLGSTKTLLQLAMAA